MRNKKEKRIRVGVKICEGGKNEKRGRARDAATAVAVQYNVAFIITVCLLTTIVKRSLFHMIQLYSLYTRFFFLSLRVFRLPLLNVYFSNVCSCTFSVYVCMCACVCVFLYIQKRRIIRPSAKLTESQRSLPRD